MGFKGYLATVLLVFLATAVGFWFWWGRNVTVGGDYQDVVITLDRGACFGTCPVYKLTIYGDGKVVYEGADFTPRGMPVVKTVGVRNAVIGKDKVRELVSEFNKVNFFSLKDSYVNHTITDAPTVITSISLDGRTKTIEHYHGDMSAPDKLTELEDKIDEVVNSDKWVKY